ncbi:pyridoxamine 5'-phosphate oxidase family protein [Planotetraspora sp. A-T 1434]|uniref:pyridoxamine 5'-phosphate oxidase family protein n=1 Tax=Planotetraspora sp. A-T 1434 TaxID=2979219 RepID=UPI0021BEE67C|nr:pyridoxamine 5'-phosphate oxidase family protein [Planotetraspora sp. A-T 1434]MCT9931090.1 pyridoxamine 5'-phosphate oxidase family protein [Planotetraspora sp. A-T 1434]
MSDLSATDRTRHRRLREQGRTDREALFAVLRAGFVCHLGVVVNGDPMVVPTVYGFDSSHIYVHGSVASRSLTHGATACVTVTHVDGLVLARSVFEHGVNYRSAMIYGVPRALEGEEKLTALKCLTEQVTPGQWDYARQPNRKELAATSILALSLEEASVKVREGGPNDAHDPHDVWAGVLPLAALWQAPVTDPLATRPVPDHVRHRAGQPAHPA